MKKILSFSLLYLLLFTSAFCVEDIEGFWKTINEKTGRAESVVAVYEHNGKFYARIIATFDDHGKIDDSIAAPVGRAPGVKGNPYYSGLDIMWNLEKKGNRYSNGRIMDPEKGRVYSAQMWREGRHLIVRGEILFFGRNQSWDPALDSDFPAGFVKPPLTDMVPNIMAVK